MIELLAETGRCETTSWTDATVFIVMVVAAAAVLIAFFRRR